MTKHAKKSAHLQAVDSPKTKIVEIPLPLLDAFASIESSYFDLCVHAGRQALGAMMEQDREDLCGPRWKRDPDRRAGRSGTTQSEITLGGRRILVDRPRVRSREGQEMIRLCTDVAHSSFCRAAIPFALETSLTLPGVSILGEEGEFGHLDGLTLVLSLLETSLTVPGVSIGGEESVFGHVDGLALVLDALETSLTFPVIFVVDERMLRHV